MDIKLFYNEDKTIVTLNVSLPLITKEKKDFTRKDAEKYLKDNNITYIKMLSGVIVSNTSEGRRKGNFSFLISSKRQLLPLSKEEQEKRKPLPPEMLVDALQDRIHFDKNPTKVRAVKSVKLKKEQ